jgi:putative autoinducer-2 (AI-2) aldolase
MPGEDTISKDKNYYTDVPASNDAFFLKGLGGHDWGIQDRMSRIFNPKSGRTLMLAFDHGYAYGPTTGLERMDVTVNPLIPHVDCLMCTRGAIRSTVPSNSKKPLCLRVTAGTSILDPNVFENECLGVDIEDAIRLNASAIAIQVCIGAKIERTTIENLTRMIDLGIKYGIPVMGVTAIGKNTVRDARYIGLASRMIAEMGAHFVKTYYCEEGFEQVTAGCPVPIVMAGGSKLPEFDALKMAYKAVQQGAAGVDMGRNIFQAGDPIAMAQAVSGLMHDDLTPEQAFEKYNDIKS